MPLSGGAFLALWNDIAPHREREYDRWHTKEHVPERVAVEGFRGARRYVNRAASAHRYFTLYEVSDLAAFEHAHYRDLVANPTPWSASMRPDFRNLVRAACRVQASKGDGIGAAIGVLCHERNAAAGAVDAIDALVDLAGVTACHVGDGGATATNWSQQASHDAPTRPFDRILLIEALDRESAAAALDHARRSLGFSDSTTLFGCGVYDLAFAFPGHDGAARGAHRRPAWSAG